MSLTADLAYRERRHSTLGMLSPAEYEQNQENAISIKIQKESI